MKNFDGQPKTTRHSRYRHLRRLVKFSDEKATHWHHEFMDAKLGPVPNEKWAGYSKGMADAYQEVFHYLSLIGGFPWK